MSSIGAEFCLRARGSGAKPVEHDGRVQIFGEVEWLLKADPATLDDAARSLAGVSERLAPELLLLSFGNAVGTFEVPGVGELEVVSGKANEGDFDRLLSELMDVASALPFAAGAAAALPFDRSVVARQDVLYHAFVYLRWVLSDQAPREDQLLGALQLILRDPHRRFERRRQLVPPDLAHNVDPGTLVHLVTGREQLDRATSDIQARIPFVRALRGYAPASVEQVQVLSTFDTAENRFIKAFLRIVMGVIDGMQAAIELRGEQGVFANRLRTDCASMARSLHPIASAGLWKDVGRMVHLPASSTVLHRRRGYRQVFRHFARLRLAARVPLATELVWDLLEARDIAELYELWCFFMLARLMTDHQGAPTHAGGPEHDAWSLRVRWGLSIRWMNGTRLIYNPQFSQSAPGGQFSYSVPFRPDIALEVPSGPNAGLHLLDAKFRLDQLTDILAEADTADAAAEAEERRGTFKRADLYKMHAYRDAIPAARSVWILYPGSEAKFFCASERGAIDLAHLPEELHGVGAVPLALAGESRFDAAVLTLRRLCGLASDSGNS